MVPSAIGNSISKELGVIITDFSFSSGGCINNGGQLKTSSGNYFLKWNDADRFPEMFEKEKRGLQILAQSQTVKVPTVYLTKVIGTCQYIIMEFIEQADRSRDYWRLLGEQLALLHKNTSNYFGLDHENYIGSLVQPNTKSKSWIEFFIEQRLAYQVRQLKDTNRADGNFVKAMETLYPKLSEIMPSEPSSLLHGDLWNGNVISSNSGNPVLIDPAVYYGHREAELAFTKVFGGFGNAFYEAYEFNFPLENGFEERYELYNLYPLLVHANLFGASYLSAAKAIIMKYA